MGHDTKGDSERASAEEVTAIVEQTPGGGPAARLHFRKGRLGWREVDNPWEGDSMKPLWLALLGAGFLLAAPAAGDTIVLKKKGELKGTIIEEDDEKVTITLSFGTTTDRKSVV